MKKNLTSFYWVLGLIFLLITFSFMVHPDSLNNYSSPYIVFSYPHPWQLDEWPAVQPNVFSVGNSNPQKPLEPFCDDENLIKFSFPANWLVQQESFSGSEIIKHIQLTAPDKKEVCLIQIWQSFKPLTEFINDIKKTPVKGDEISYFSVSDTEVKGHQAYLVFFKYGDVLCKEVYFTYQNLIYRIGYLYSGPRWTKDQERNFQTILQSINL